VSAAINVQHLSGYLSRPLQVKNGINPVVREEKQLGVPSIRTQRPSCEKR
jgi:hypothetical protein